MNGSRLETTLAAFVERLRDGAGDERARSALVRFLQTATGGARVAARVWSARGTGEVAVADEAALEELVRQLGSLKGIPMKVGQLIGFLELDLPEEMRRLFAVLQTQAQPTSFEVIERLVRQDLGGSAAALLATMERVPVAVASIGQVHRAVVGGRPVAVKVRHPHVERSIRADLTGAAVATAIAARVLPGLGTSAREFVDEARARFLEECDYQLEAERQRLFHRIFADHPDVVVPEVLDDWSGPGVLTTAWQDGEDLEAFVASATPPERDRAGRALFEAYVGTLYRRGLFHADPHPGNYRFRDGGAVVLFDYGCIRVFEPEVVAAFVELAEAVRGGDEGRMRAALRALGAEPGRGAGAFDRIRTLLQGFFAPLVRPGPHPIDSSLVLDLRQMTSDKLAIARMRLPGKLLFLMRLRFGLYSVLARLGAVCDWGALEAGWAGELRSR
jgi:predicted unusual protein kinase regulating ubiquinone biosynthesis (AarF/ABC1/UbiB family)